MLKFIAIGLYICGACMLLLALLSGGAALTASVHRFQHGRSHLFADVEFFGLLTLICCVLGAFSLSMARRIARRLQQGKE
ncbi:MAG TPA: hypothetical protein VL122_07130 [Nitrospirota bacterium]|nr:hypothetical protein [Nitrospirota bacterium]